MKRIHYIVITIIIVILFSSCIKKKDDEKVIAFKDCAGTKISINAKINKVIVTDQSCTAFLIAMGEADKIVGVHGSILSDKWSSFFVGDKLSNIKRFGYKPSAESIYKENADIVILNDAAYAAELRKCGINAICFSYKNIAELFFAVDMLGNIFGDNAKSYAENWKNYTQKTIDSIALELNELKDSERKTVYYINAATNPSDLYSTFGGNSIVEEWINVIGAKLITSEFDNISSIESEIILSKNPEIVFIGGYAEYSRKDALLSDPLWKNIDAIQNQDIFLLPTSFASYEKFSVEFPMLLRYSAHKLHPSLCAFDGINTLHDFYKEFYNLEISNEYLENLLMGFYPDGTKKD